MRDQARVVIIGGGIAGCSALYHLTQMGWTDVMLLERDELTSGSTWHAAAQVTQFGGNQTFVLLKKHSIDLYRELAADPEFPINYHITGGMRLAHTEDQMDIYRHYVQMAKGVGIDFELIDGAEAGRRHKLMTSDGLLGAWWDPLDGDIDPSQLTQALARRARAAGAEVVRFNPVTGLTQQPSGEWIVHTKKGDIRAEIIVNAGGYRANEIGAMMGVEHPVVSMEHMYFLTDPIAALEEMEERVPIIRDPGDDFYSRQEKKGLLVGVYEQACKSFGMDGIDPDFTMALCPNDLDRCLDNMEGIFERLPALTETGIHTIVNGPITYTPDGMPLVGPIPGMRNAYCITGLRAGIGEGGGHGKLLAEWIVEGQTEWESWFLDPRRFTQHANTEFTLLKSIEDYQREFHYHMPHEERPAGRLAKTTSLYPVLEQQGAEFGVVNGWERATFFKPSDDFEHLPSYRYQATKDVVSDEVMHLRKNVGVMEVNGFGRIAIKGEGAEAFLNKLTCSTVPKTIGKVSLCYLLNHKGSVLAEATIAKIDDNHYWYGCAAAAERHDWDHLVSHLPEDGSVTVENLTNSHVILVVAGPRSRDLLSSLCPRDDLSASALPWMRGKTITIGHARAYAMAVSFSGELAFELHIAAEQLYLAWQTLMRGGAAYNIKPFGLYAAESMRLEKGYRHWKSDLLIEFSPFESGLDAFVKMQKGDFLGKEALSQRDVNWQFITMKIESDHAAPYGGDPIFAGETQIGSITSAGFGARVGCTIGYGFVKADADLSDLQVGILQQRYPAHWLNEALYDPENERVKA